MSNDCSDNPQIAVLSFQENTDAIGAKYIHSYLLGSGIASRMILVPRAERSTHAALITFLRDHRISIAGISLMTPETPRAFAFADEAMKALPELRIVFGGIHATIDPESCLAHGHAAICGEGEQVFAELIRRVSAGEELAGQPGVCVRRNGEIIRTPPAPLVDDLNQLPFPGHRSREMYVVHAGAVCPMDETLFARYSRYDGRFLNLMTTRGCPFACTYCCNSVYSGLYGRWKVRFRSVENVIAELEQEKAAHPGLCTVNIHDDCFLANSQEWLAEFAEQYRERIGIPFVIRTTPVHVRRDTLLLLKRAGLAWVMMGLQSGSDRVNLEIYGRHTTSQQVLQAARTIREAGLYAILDVILDNPYETDEDVLATLETVLELPRPFQFQLFGLRFYKGTRLHEKAVREGIDTGDPLLTYLAFQPTTLNLLIQMAPLYPAGLVRWLAANRTRGFVRPIVRTLAFVGNLVLAPVSYLLLAHRAYGSRIATTAGLFSILCKTFIRQRIAPVLAARRRAHHAPGDLHATPVAASGDRG